MDNSSEIKNVDYFSSIEDAIMNDRTEEASSLIQKEDLDEETLNSLLRSAINRNNHTLVKMIIDHGQLNSPSIYVQNVFNTAVAKRELLVIEFMVSYCQFSKLLDKHIPHDAVLDSDPQSKEFVESLLKWNFTINPISNYDEDFVFAAVEKGYAPIVSQLLNLEIDVNMMDSSGLNLLTTACFNKHHETLETLLKHNACVDVVVPTDHPTVEDDSCLDYDINSFNNLLPLDHKMRLHGITCLHIAAFRSDPKMIRILLQYSTKTIDDLTVLQVACVAAQQNCEEIIRIFLDHYNVADMICQRINLLKFCMSLYEKDEGYNIIKFLLQQEKIINQIRTPGNTLVFEAAKNGHYKIVKTLLKHNACINVVVPVDHRLVVDDSRLCHAINLYNNLFPSGHKMCLHRITSLHIAAFYSDPEMTKILLKYSAKMIGDLTVLRITCIAAQNNCKEIVRIFLDYGFNVAGIVCEGITLLNVCVNLNSKDHGHDVVKLLLHQEKALRQIQTPGNKLVFEAMANGHREIVVTLLKHKAPVDVIMHADHQTVQNDSRLFNDIHSFNNLFPWDNKIRLHNITCFHIAAFRSDPQIIELLLKYNTLDDLTVLQITCIAARNGCEEIVRKLLEYGFNITDISCNGINLLNFCITLKSKDRGYDVVELFLQQNNPNIEIYSPRNTLVYRAIKNGHHAIAKLMLDYKADVQFVGTNGNTVIHKAIEDNFDAEYIKVLLKLNVPVDAENARGLTPFEVACKRSVGNQLKIITKALLDYGADVYRGVRFLSTEMQNGRVSRNTVTEVIKIIVHHSDKLKIAGIETKDAKLISRSFRLFRDNAQQFQANCKQEIEKMKIERIMNTSVTGNITFYDLLQKHDSFLNRFIKNENVQKTLDLRIYDKKFPLYIDIIRNRFREAQVRYPVMILAREYFSIYICQRLPYECIDMIFSYLTLKELNTFNTIIEILQKLLTFLKNYR